MLYPIGVQSFAEIIEKKNVYVDKTHLLYRLISQGKYYFLSRPRRFGKSLLISTMEAYFTGKKDLFANLAIGKLEKEFEQYNVDIEYEHERFKTLDCFPIFMEHISFYTDSDGNKMKAYQYFIDFGEDAEGAARLITKFWKEVYKIHFDANIEYYTNAGNDNISKCRNEIDQELCGVEYNDDSESSQYWYYFILVIVGLLVFFITRYS